MAPGRLVTMNHPDGFATITDGGGRFIGWFRSYRGGHKLNAAALSRLLSDSSAYQMVEAERRERNRSAEKISLTGVSYAPWTR